MVTDCAWRITPKSEIILGKFDLDKGCLVEYPEVFKVNYDIKTWANYDLPVVGARLPWDKKDLVDLLCSDKRLLMAINYQSIGAILIYKDSITKWIKAKPFKNFPVVRLELNPLLLSPFRCIGIKNTKLLTLRTLQFQERLVTVRIGNHEYLYSNEGRIEVNIYLDNYDYIEGEPYRAAYGSKAFGYGKYEDRYFTFKVINNKLIKHKEVKRND